MYLLLYSINPLIVTTMAMRSKSKSFLVRKKKGLIGVCGQVEFGCGYRPRFCLRHSICQLTLLPTLSYILACPTPGLIWVGSELLSGNVAIIYIPYCPQQYVICLQTWLHRRLALEIYIYLLLLLIASVCDFLSSLSQPTFRGGRG